MRCLVVANRALLSRRHLEEQAAHWLAEAGETPPGNGPEQALWEVSAFVVHPGRRITPVKLMDAHCHPHGSCLLVSDNTTLRSAMRLPAIRDRTW